MFSASSVELSVHIHKIMMIYLRNAENMRQLAAYSLSSPTINPSAVRSRQAEAISIIEKWLSGKGAGTPLQNEGFFKSKTRNDDTGIYRVTKHEHSGDESINYVLFEKSNSGLDFTTEISVLRFGDSVTIFCSLSVSSSEDAILNAYADARCPSVIRELLASKDDWLYAGSQISQSLAHVNSDSDVSALVQHIKNKESRKMPIVVVSEYDGSQLWPSLAEKMARDLVGAAEVYHISEAGSQLLTAKVGRKHSCYFGAVRLYWPATDADLMPRSFVWTEEVLLPSEETDDERYEKRFLNKLRNLILSATAVSVAPNKRFKELEQLTATKEFSDAHKSSEEKMAQLQAAIAELTRKLEEADYRNRQLAYQLQQATTLAEIKPGDAFASNDDENFPTKGETRFYKKIANAGKADKMVQSKDCGHNSWQSSNGADKAKKGLARLLGRNDWKSVYHCGTCTNGGHWKVEW